MRDFDILTFVRFKEFGGFHPKLNDGMILL